MQTRPPWSLRAAMLLQFAAGGAVLPFVTLVLRDRGLDFAHISFIFSVASATLLVFPFLWGMLADRYLPLNRLFTLLNLATSGALILFALQRDFAGLLFAFALFSACFNPMLTLINALCFHHLTNPREQFGALRAWGSLGWIIPFLPISIWLVRDRQSSFGFVVYIGIGLSLAMTVLSFWLPHTPPRANRAGLAGLSHDYSGAVKQLLRDPNYVVVLLSLLLVAGSYSLLNYYSPALLQDLGVPRPWIGPIQAIGVLFEIVLFQWQPVVLRRWSHTTTVLIGCIALVLRHGLFSFVSSIWILAGSYLLTSVVIVFFHMGMSVLANAIAPVEVRATAQTLIVLVSSGLGPMFANWTAGKVAAGSENNLRPVFLLATGLAAGAACLIAARGRQFNTIDRGSTP